MTDFTPSDEQAEALRRIKEWFAAPPEGRAPYFNLRGYAGSGKTSLMKHLIGEELGLSAEGLAPSCCVATYTGKAALNMTRRTGLPCSTIHRLIYSTYRLGEAELAKLRKEIAELEEAAIGLAGAERRAADAVIAQKHLDLKEARGLQVLLNPQSKARDAKLVVIDEHSMVDQVMAKDLLSFGTPVLALGDPGQLPPIRRGKGYFSRGEADFMLTQVHRQAEESAIIRLATWARTGRHIPFGEHDANVWKLPRGRAEPAQLLAADQVLVGYNQTRLELNNAMRREKGFSGLLPNGPAEKIVCLKNDYENGLVNGMPLRLGEAREIDEARFEAQIDRESVAAIGEWEEVGERDQGGRQHFLCYAGGYHDHVAWDKKRDDRDWRIKSKLVDSTFGYAITTYRAQGSQYPNVIVWDDGFGHTETQRRQHLYTAVTRAETGLVIFA